jgi:hypothetical protein
MLRYTAFTIVVACSAGLLDASMPAQALPDVMRRASDYVVEYGDSLATVIADEEYTQQLVARTGGAELRRRVLRSELAFVHLASSNEWQAFRNVVTADGADVAGAGGRLERIFQGASRSTIAQARAIAEASARYNLGPLHRNFNAPTMPLQFLHPSRRESIRFDKRGEDTVAGERTWIVRFREDRHGTLIRSTDGRAVPVEGQLWIVPGDGRVIRASFFAKDFLPANPGPKTSRADVDVTWRPEPKLKLWVPAEMRERYSGPWTEAGVPFDITGTAVYSNYRRFDVDVRLIDRR